MAYDVEVPPPTLLHDMATLLHLPPLLSIPRFTLRTDDGAVAEADFALLSQCEVLEARCLAALEAHKQQKHHEEQQQQLELEQLGVLDMGHMSGDALDAFVRCLYTEELGTEDPLVLQKVADAQKRFKYCGKQVGEEQEQAADDDEEEEEEDEEHEEVEKEDEEEEHGGSLVVEKHLGKLFESGAGSDVTIQYHAHGNTHAFALHRAVLLARSPFFAVLVGDSFAEARQACITLHGDSPRAMELLFRYFYTDALAVPESTDLDTLLGLAAACAKYAVPRCGLMALPLIARRLRDDNLAHAMEWARCNGQSDVYSLCVQYVFDDLARVIRDGVLLGLAHADQEEVEACFRRLAREQERALDKAQFHVAVVPPERPPREQPQQPQKQPQKQKQARPQATSPAKHQQQQQADKKPSAAQTTAQQRTATTTAEEAAQKKAATEAAKAAARAQKAVAFEKDCPALGASPPQPAVHRAKLGRMENVSQKKRRGLQPQPEAAAAEEEARKQQQKKQEKKPVVNKWGHAAAPVVPMSELLKEASEKGTPGMPHTPFNAATHTWNVEAPQAAAQSRAAAVSFQEILDEQYARSLAEQDW